ncbi:META domain-containing protein [Bacteroides sp. 51]|uniref:META domain-containing protein n=1 Tax=Bacteroides sp. 51 TaxID=2302938 RepID=UPI0013D26E75|nr:META domain-containing protein [Bacteroides sp. 51]NDV81231.1 META domain-containing protein [Bacteroides sp. 51]
MKKVVVSLCAICAMMVVTSCRSSKEVVTLGALNGEWNIVEINGSAVAPGTGQNVPYIGFDAVSGKIYGNSGCNRMMGSFDRSSKPGELDLSTIAGTRMMCPDMTMEQNVLNALKIVKGYKKAGADKIALTNAHKRPVIVLEPKTTVDLITSLEGEWKITEIKDEALPAKLEKEPFIVFDLKAKRIHGNAGCNMINGGFITEENNPRSLSFPAVAATMMACPDMSIERKVLDALNAVKYFDVSADKVAGLYGEDGALLLVLKKK